MQQTKFHSYKIGKLAKGCQLCVQGAKEVLFITGLCPRSCYFCPISDKKYKKDVIYADETPVKNIRDIIKEAKLIDAKGAGITGGDPLCKLQRTIQYIRKLKKEFGKEFHLHLYTSLDLVTENSLKRLYNAGLDEIRFHLDLDDDKLWDKIILALKFDWDIGVEIPVIPKKEKNLKKIILFLDKINQSNKNKIKFLNLNELEIADNKANKLIKLGHKTKNTVSYAVKGSEDLAMRLMDFIEKKNIHLNVHYCTVTLKDKVQMSNRIRRRAKNIKNPYDKISQAGTLIRGVIYLNEFLPKANYRKKLSSISRSRKQSLLKKLNELNSILKKEFKINTEIDKNKLRLLTSEKTVKTLSRKIHPKLFKLAIVEEYPTYDAFEVEIEFLQ